MRKIVFTVFILFFFSATTYAQENAKDTVKLKMRQSALYGTLGIFPLYGNINLSYEIMLVKRPDKFFKTRGIRVSSGFYWYYSDESWNTILTYNLLTGANKSHLELGMGATYMQFLTIDQFFIVPSLNLGYRYQKPAGKFIFRVGAGWPELVFLSFGSAF